MKILVIADPHLPVPPTHYGGAERIIDLYCGELQRLGHSVDLIAAPGSKSYGGRLYLHSPPSRSYPSRARRKIQFQIQSLLAAKGCDWVFNHGRFDYLESLLRARFPIVHLSHNPLDSDQIAFMEKRVHSRFLLYGVSRHQLSLAPTNLPTTVIHNFVDTSRYRHSNKSEGYLAFLGRLTQNKGIHTAIEVARICRKQLRIAGTIPDEPGARDMFDRVIRPSLDDGLVSYLGPVDDRQKQDLLGGADALLFPTQWNEPCAVVVSESLACGTPVVAFDIASNREIIEPGVTGLLCPSVGDAEEMAEAVQRIDKVSRRRCRAVAEERFDVKSATSRLLLAIDRIQQAGR